MVRRVDSRRKWDIVVAIGVVLLSLAGFAVVWLIRLLAWGRVSPHFPAPGD